MKNVLITGGAGFMGSNVVSHFHRHYPDYEIVVLDMLTYAGHVESIPKEVREDERFHFWYGNIKNSQLVDSLVAKADVVIHLAAESHVARSLYDNAACFDTNVMGTQVIANAVLKHIDSVERLVHISTSEVYGTAVRRPMDEEHPLDALTPYAAAKLGAERLVYSYEKTYDIPSVILRPFNNCGPRQHLEKVIPRFITSAILDEPITVHGDGSYTRDWVYVEDFCAAVDRAVHVPLDTVKGEIINVGTGEEASILDIANLVMEHVPRTKSEIEHTSNRPGQVACHIASTAKAKKLLGWAPATPFRDALERTVAWYQANSDWWKPLLWMRSIPVTRRDGTREFY